MEASNTNTKQESWARRWVRRLYIGLRGYFAIVGLVVTLLPMMVMCSLATAKFDLGSSGRVATFKPSEPATLHVYLSGSIAPASEDLAEAFFARLSGRQTSLRVPEIQRALRRAGKDPLVKGIELTVNDISGSPTDFTELRRNLELFRDQGKHVKILLHEPSDWQYYVGSVANELVINPAATVAVPGPMFQFVYLGEALRKIGVDIELVRAGKYKSAAEPLIQNDPSPATLEQYRAMESTLRQHWIEVVAKGRDKQPAEVEAWLKQSFFTAADAITAGLIDGTGYIAYEKDDDDDSLRNYMQATEGSEAAERDVGGIALIEARGNIVMRDDGSGSEVIAPGPMIEEINWALHEDDVKAVVLRIDSPGGSATASDVIWGELAELAKAKPLIVSMASVAASGGYYIAAPAKRIFAEPTTITGSIGVFGVIPNFEAFRDKYGVSFHVVTGSERAALFDPGRKSTAFDKALLESGIDQVYKVFLDRVAQGRKIPMESVEALAQGRVYTGKEALDLKLVDQLGGLYDAFRSAKELAGFDPEKLYPVMRFGDEGFDLGRCLTSPARLRRCLGGAQTSLFGPDLSATPLGPVLPYAMGLGQLAATARPGDAWALATTLPLTQF